MAVTWNFSKYSLFRPTSSSMALFKRFLVQRPLFQRRLLILILLVFILLLVFKWYGEARSAPSSFHQREMIARDHNFLSPLSSQVNAEDFLKAAFQRMDKNLDGELTEEEMSMWVLGVGIQVASSLLSNNLMTFTRIDQGHDGLVSWPEYITYYLQTVKGIPLPPNVDPEEFLEKQERSIREELSEQRASWYEAVRDNPEALNIDEFLAFTHPEQSHSLLLRIVDDMFVALDVDGGETLDLGEFEVVKPEDVGMDAEKIKELFQMEDKRALFKMIDEDGDGKITKRELLQYLDPRNRARALLRARDLIQSIDDDKDGLVSMNELLAHQGPLMANPFFNLRAPANRVSG